MTAITTARLTPDPQRFPPGTNVSAYRASAWSSTDRSVAPTGAADAGPVAVAADGTLTFTGLTDQTTYFAYAAGSGAPVRFTTRHDYADDLTGDKVGLSADNTFTGANVFNNDVTNWKSKATFGNTSIVGLRGAWKSSYAMGPHAATAGDTVVSLNQAILIGDWSTDSGGNSPGFMFGANDYIVTGTGAGDALNVNTLVGRLTEADVKAPNASITTVVGFQAEAGFAGATAGGTIGTLIVNRVMNPRRKDGAVAGTVTGNAYGLYVMKAVASDTGAAAAYSVYVAGGDTFLNGIVTVAGDDAARTPLVVRNTAGSSVAPFAVQTSTGTNLLSVSSAGAITAPSAMTAYNGTSNQASFLVFNDGSNHAAVQFGSPADTQIFRASAGVIGFPDGHKIQAGSTNGLTIATGAAQKLGFYGAAPVVKGAVAGSRAGNAALANLLTYLASMGILTDSTTA